MIGGFFIKNLSSISKGWHHAGKLRLTFQKVLIYPGSHTQ